MLILDFIEPLKQTEKMKHATMTCCALQATGNNTPPRTYCITRVFSICSKGSVNEPPSLPGTRQSLPGTRQREESRSGFCDANEQIEKKEKMHVRPAAKIFA